MREKCKRNRLRPPVLVLTLLSWFSLTTTYPAFGEEMSWELFHIRKDIKDFTDETAGKENKEKPEYHIKSVPLGNRLLIKEDAEESTYLQAGWDNLGKYYSITGLWNDRGIHMKYIDTLGMEEEEFVQRNGKGYRIGKDFGRAFTALSGMLPAMTEPENYSGYQWYLRTDQGELPDGDIGGALERGKVLSGETNAVFQPDKSYGDRAFFCIGRIGDQTGTEREVLLGEKYAVSYIAFPKARDLLYELV